MGGPGADVLVQPLEVGQGLVHPPRMNMTCLAGCGQCILHLAEQVAHTQQCQQHAAQLTKDIVPLLDRGELLSSGHAGQDLGEMLDSEDGEGNCHGSSVNYPDEDGLDL